LKGLNKPQIHAPKFASQILIEIVLIEKEYYFHLDYESHPIDFSDMFTCTENFDCKV